MIFDILRYNIETIIEKLERFRPQVILNRAPNEMLDGIRLYDREKSKPEAGHLYITPCCELGGLSAWPDRSCILSIGDASKLDCRGASAINLFNIGGDVTVRDVANRVLEVFNVFQNWENETLRMIDEGESLQSFIDAGVKIIGLPLSIMNMAKETLAASAGIPACAVDADSIISRCVNAELRQHHSGSAYAAQQYLSENGRSVLVQSLKNRQNVIGFLIAHCPEGRSGVFNRGTEQQVDFLANSIEKRLQAEDFQHLSSGLREDCLIVDLLENRIDNESDAREILMEFCWNEKMTMRILRIESDNPASGVENLRLMRAYFDYNYPQSKPLIYHCGLVVITVSSSSAFTPDSRDSRFMEMLEHSRAHCGASNPFRDLQKAAGYYRQAQKALWFGRKRRKQELFHEYTHHMVDHSLEMLANVTDLRMLLHPAIARLSATGSAADSMRQTLKVYLECERNIGWSAERLFLHRNSITYRINKMEELLGLDLADSSTRTQLLLSLEILDYLDMCGG